MVVKRSSARGGSGAYYRQNHRLDDERDATVAVRAEQRDRLLAAYGREHHERGGFLLGLAAQYNRRTVYKQLARDQRAQNRMEMRTAGFRPRRQGEGPQAEQAHQARGGREEPGRGGPRRRAPDGAALDFAFRTEPFAFFFCTVLGLGFGSRRRPTLRSLYGASCC